MGLHGLILTHNLCTVITCFFAFAYTLIHFKNLKETHVKKGLIINLIFIVTITSFFWMPLLETKLSADYQVYEENAMATEESVVNNALTFRRLFVTPTDEYYVFELGIHIIIMLCFSVVALKRLREDLKKHYIFFLICGLICVIMSTNIWPWKIMPDFLNIIQFPWRMLFMATFFFSIVCGINMSVALKRFRISDAIILSIICILYISAFKVPVNSDLLPIQDVSLGIMSGKNDEVVAGTAKAEYLPKKAYEDRFYIATREDVINILSGKAIIKDEEKNGTSYKAKIKTIEETVLELPYIYYPGYQVRADGIIIEMFETEKGFLGINLEPDEEIQLEVEYAGSNIMKFSMIISVVGIILFSVYVWKKH